MKSIGGSSVCSEVWRICSKYDSVIRQQHNRPLSVKLITPFFKSRQRLQPLRATLPELVHLRANERYAARAGEKKYSRVSFCDGSFYDDSLLRPLAIPTKHSRLVVHQCRNSSVISLLSALLALSRCACVSAFSILVQFFYADCYFSTYDVHRKDRKEEKIKTFFLDVFWTTAWGFFSKIKSDLIDILSIVCVIFCTPNSLN